MSPMLVSSNNTVPSIDCLCLFPQAIKPQMVKMQIILRIVFFIIRIVLDGQRYMIILAFGIFFFSFYSSWKACRGPFDSCRERC